MPISMIQTDGATETETGGGLEGGKDHELNATVTQRIE